MEENKLGKYLKYAIGEILLVVIGILIALQINNWNGKKRSELDDVKFLSNLRSEIEIDTLAIGKKMKNYTLFNEILKQTLKFLNGPTEITEHQRQIISTAIADFPGLTPIYKNIEKNNAKLADGTLLNINNQLNMKYQQYLDGTKSNTEIINKLGETLQLVATHDVYPNVDLDYVSPKGAKVYFNIEELKSNRLIKNAIHTSIRYRDMYINMMRSQKEEAIDLINILNEELK